MISRKWVGKEMKQECGERAQILAGGAREQGRQPLCNAQEGPQHPFLLSIRDQRKPRKKLRRWINFFVCLIYLINK